MQEVVKLMTWSSQLKKENQSSPARVSSRATCLTIGSGAIAIAILVSRPHGSKRRHGR